MSNKPNLFIIGAQKCGTTSLHDYLARHPDIFMSEPKEPGFFVPEMTYYSKDEAWYLGLFAEAGGAKWIGESSTHYSKLPLYEGVPARIQAWSLEPRFIYLMRDPVDRAISHYWHNVRKLQETRPIERAVREDAQYRAFGDYAMQLRPWFEAFGRDSVLPLVFEELVAQPEQVLERLLHWLDLSGFPEDRELGRKNVRPPTIRKARGRGLLNSVRSWQAWGAVSPAVPRPLKEWAKNLALEETDPRNASHDEAVASLKPWARERVRDLEELIERDFPLWPSGT